MRTHFKIAQKEVAKEQRKRNRRVDIGSDPKQMKLDQFGIQPFAQTSGLTKETGNLKEQRIKKDEFAKRGEMNIVQKRKNK